MNKLREKTEYILMKGYLSFLRICPAPIIYGTCRGFAALFYTVGARRRQITLANLELAFPDLADKERKRIARATYDHFGRFAAESAMILSRKLGKEKFNEMIDGSEIRKLQELEAGTDKGILVITGHLGNFELMAHYTGMQLKRPGCVVARRGNNQLVDDQLVTPLRESFGNRVIYKERALPHVARALRKGEHVGLLIDIKSSTKHGEAVTFFGNKTYAINSSAYLQVKLNPVVVPVTMIRTASKRYKLIVGDPIHWDDNGKPAKEQISELTQIHQTALENLIRQYPEQWLWMHDRWKIPQLERKRRQKKRARKRKKKQKQS